MMRHRNNFHNATGFVMAVENTLGWVVEETPHKPAWKIYAIEAMKVNRKIATDPDLYTWENLSLTLDYCRRRKMTVKWPVGVLFHVEKALAAQPKVERARPLQELVEAAIAREMGRHDDDSEMWISRFTRASGPGLVQLYQDWVLVGRAKP